MPTFDLPIRSVVGESITFATGNLIRAVNIPKGARWVTLRCTTTASAMAQFCPKLRQAFKFTAVGSVYRDDTAALTERGTNQTATFNSMVATNDFIYIGCDVPFRGVYVNVVNANATASVLSAFYWDGSTWQGLTETDGTASAGATLAIDNIITWTMPTDWAKTSVNNSAPYFYVRFNSDGGTDSATSLAEVIPLSVQSTGTAPGTAIQIVAAITTAVDPPKFWIDGDAVGGVEIVEANNGVIRTEFFITSQVAKAFIE